MTDNGGKEQWYTNKDLYEMLTELKISLAKYNNLRAVLNDVIESQKSLTKIVEGVVVKVEQLEASNTGRRQAFGDGKDIVMVLIAAAGWVVALIKLIGG